MNISKSQQRTLHALAQGGRIELERNDKGRVVSADCMTRDGWTLTDCTVAVFQALRRKRLIASQGSGPYRITRLGLANLRAQLDNRVGAKAW
ncbi:YjhX family toxin [Caulobacter sp. BE264]|uniref:YjhX family toxin n=1 Tax=Caulobacter sp. BE264 TaxID=2817724 RepID=UPI00286CD201|nr:YjhX family toxin [Caulobacter sp. BE264]